MEQNKLATKEQVKAINAILAKNGQMQNKATIIASSTNGRTSHSSALFFNEARALLKALTNSRKSSTRTKQPTEKMIGKLFAMAHEIHWIKEKVIVTEKGIEKTKDYTTLHSWINKYGYLTKPLSKYTYDELPELVSQFEFHIYNDYLKQL